MGSKPFFVVLVFILLIVVFAGGAVGSTDLTPNTPPDTSGSDSGAVDPSIFGGSSSSDGMPVSGAESSSCGGTYTVRSGDTLSGIARTCGVTLQQILAVNNSISNPNIIRVGQKITIVRPKATAKPTATPKPTAAPKAKPSSTPARGLHPGAEVSVQLSGFPANTEVQLSISKSGGKATTLQKVKTDAKGALQVNVKIPKTAKAAEKWVVSAATTKKPKVTAKSAVFVIEK